MRHKIGTVPTRRYRAGVAGFELTVEARELASWEWGLMAALAETYAALDELSAKMDRMFDEIERKSKEQEDERRATG